MSTTIKSGPRTPQGKKRSSLNALKHGLTARSPHALDQIARVHGISFPRTLRRMNRHYRPRDPVEEELVIRIARCVWRLSLSAAMEHRIIERGWATTRPGASYERILRYERLVDIHLHRALTMLDRKREREAAGSGAISDPDPSEDADENISQNELPSRSAQA
jgi:hypothetical protein